MILNQINKTSTMLDLIVAYKQNTAIIGNLNINRHLYQEFIKVLTICPFDDKKLKYFRTLNPSEKVGYLSRHIIKAAKIVGVPKVYIKNYLKIKYEYKTLRKNAKNAKIVIDKLYKETLQLCFAIFEIWDKNKNI